MAKFGEGLAAKALSMAVRGDNVPLNVQQAAARVQGGSDRPSDVGLLREFLNVRRSGAKQTRRAIGAIRGSTQPILNTWRAYDNFQNVSARGGDTSGATLNLIRTMTREVESLTRGPAFRRLAEETGRWLGKSALGQRLGISAASGIRGARSLTRAAGMAGLGIEAAVAGAQYGLQGWDARNYNQAAGGLRFDLSRRYGINQNYMTNQANRIKQGVVSSQSGFGYIRHGLSEALGDLPLVGHLFASDDVQKEADEKLKARAELINKARSRSSDYGVDALMAQIAAAKRKGIPFSELTEYEKNEAVDNAVAGSIDPRSSAWDGAVNTRLALQNPWDKLNDINRPPELMRAKRENIALDLIEEQMRTNDRVKEVIAEEAKKIVIGVTVQQQYDKERVRRQAQAGWGAFMSRHRVNNWD